MKHGVVAVVVAGALLLSASGSTLAGHGWGTSGDSDVVGSSRPDFSGKLGIDPGKEQRSPSAEVPGGADGEDVDLPVVLGAKVGGGADRPVALVGKLGVATGEG